jgi:uncharacterized protein
MPRERSFWSLNCNLSGRYNPLFQELALPCYFARPWALVPVCVGVGLALAVAHHTRTCNPKLVISPEHDVLPANGYATSRLKITDGTQSKPDAVAWSFEAGRTLGDIEIKNAEAYLRAGVTPGSLTLMARSPGFQEARVSIQLRLDPTDQFGDGMPDFARLDSQEDQTAFRHWFAYLAEGTYFQKGEELPAEVNDCAALIRFAYREALRKHDAGWASHWHLSQLPAVASVGKYQYPHTGLGAGLFRTRPGAFSADDTSNGAFAQFADAESLRRYNTHFVSRQLSAARPGDLLFFRQEGHRMPFHTMIYLGRSSFTDGNDWLIYHTGPSDGRPGEIRRVAVRELQQHREFSWRPLPQNPAFLGVYRWNILREED